ncbi:death-on-curing protein [Tersicoccus phoenicis]|uniref:Death-on-curing protein n=1 Tax=Tersicoccus phoenicis TaxID=554083 RepID=A0A1R1LEP6_9MICC|nr:type II toxin-antitoxin system death-on-curing family toxin [Tersicoccus phoenicis]OMH25992.1 death-on-curing protein [Tersicoccus phoenicis]
MSSSLQLEDVLPLVRRLGFHVRDAGLLGSALARPSTTVMGELVYPTLPLQAAALLESLARNHGLLDGNKRTAWILTVVFLRLQGYEHDLDADAVVELVVGVAAGHIDLEHSADILGPHLRR